MTGRPRALGAWLPTAGGAVVLGVVVWRVGPSPFVDALRAAGPAVLAVALLITAGTTLACAWRWRALARRLGAEVGLGEAIAAYYRSQLLNATLPGGVLGDVHRAVRHGALPVVADRGLGQAVQVALGGAVVLAGPAPAAALLVAVGVAVALVRWPVVVGASLAATAGHAAVFCVAARAAGTDASLDRILPLAMVVLVAAALPLNVAGWGPREGAAAWAFASAGLGAAQGATVGALLGVLALVGVLPGVPLLAADALRARARRPPADAPPGRPVPTPAEVIHG